MEGGERSLFLHGVFEVGGWDVDGWGGGGTEREGGF
jgi:hypothetical protein